VAGRLIWVLLKHWKTNAMLVLALWFGWKEKFWQDPLYRFTFPLVILLCSIPLLDELIEYCRGERSAAAQPHPNRVRPDCENE